MHTRTIAILFIAAAIGIAGCQFQKTGASVVVPDETLQYSIPKIDIHTHYYDEHPDLLQVLDDWNMRAVLIITSGRNIDERRQRIRDLYTAHPNRFILGTSFDAFRFNEPGFVDTTLAKLREDVDHGAKIVKVWKNVGLEVKDENDEYVQIDHPKFQPIWDFLAENDIPVLAHIAEPRAAWQALDESSPHYHYYSSHPQYHAYNLPEMPRWEEIIAARDNWLRNNPELTVIGAHLGSMAHNVDEVAARLDQFPNFHVETAERFGDMTNQPSQGVRDFLLKYQDRVIYGTDLFTQDAELARIDTIMSLHWEYLTSADSVHFDNRKITFSNWTQGLDLPEDVLRKVYHDNAVRLMGLTPGEDASAARTAENR